MKEPDFNVIRQWLIASKGDWATIAYRSGVSIRTLSNIVAEHYTAPRKMTLRCLDEIRRKMK